MILSILRHNLISNTIATKFHRTNEYIYEYKVLEIYSFNTKTEFAEVIQVQFFT